MNDVGAPPPVMEVSNLRKSFRIGLRMKRVEAVKGISFQVQPGEVFGFLGPNGAGKTTTIKTCMGLIRPTSGTVRLFGADHESLHVRTRIGFLPEHPYFYDYLKPVEILDFYGRLFGIEQRERKRRIERLLDRVGLSHAKDRTLRRFSKGMLQRVGIAQALINDPDLVVLDEPLSGLDPIGRKEIRDILVDLRAARKTIFFSSHILSDIEMICDRVAIINFGKLQSIGTLEQLLHPDRMSTEITFMSHDPELLERVAKVSQRVDRLGDYSRCVVDGRPDVVLKMLVDGGVSIDSVTPKRESLEDLFVKEAIRGAREQQMERNQ